MNNVIILGKVIFKSTIHFDYLDRLKANFSICVVEENNMFKIVISEKYIDVKILNDIYTSIELDSEICVYGNVIKDGNNNFLFICKDLYM